MHVSEAFQRPEIMFVKTYKREEKERERETREINCREQTDSYQIGRGWEDG